MGQNAKNRLIKAGFSRYQSEAILDALSLDAFSQEDGSTPEDGQVVQYDNGRTVFGGGGGGTGLFSMAARYWFSSPFSGPFDSGSALDRGPLFDWDLVQYQDGTYSSDYQQHQVLQFGEAGIFSVTLAYNVPSPTADPLTDRAVNVAILAGEEQGPYIQTNFSGMVEVAGGATAPSVSATFAAAAGDMHHLAAYSNDGGCLTATAYLTVVKLAPYA